MTREQALQTPLHEWTVEHLQAIGACVPGIDQARKYPTLAEAWERLEQPSLLIQVLASQFRPLWSDPRWRAYSTWVFYTDVCASEKCCAALRQLFGNPFLKP